MREKGRRRGKKGEEEEKREKKRKKGRRRGNKAMWPYIRSRLIQTKKKTSVAK